MTLRQGSATAVKCTLQGSVISAAKDSIAFLNAKVVGYPLLRGFIVLSGSVYAAYLHYRPSRFRYCLGKD